MKLSASIVVYNNDPKKVEMVLNSLMVSNSDLQVFIIDNSKRDFNLNPNIPPGFHYLKTEHNIGYGAGHNLALKRSLDAGIKYHLVLNPDIVFKPSVIKKLYEFMESSPDVGNVMPRVLYPDGQDQYLAKLLPTPKNMGVRLFHEFLPRKMIDKVNTIYELQFMSLKSPIEVPSLSGCFMFLRCDALRKVGLFDERFFLYFEDFDLVRRINKHYKVVYYPHVSITHHFERASRKNIFALASHLASGIKYFNKWGWYKDEQRDVSNKETVAEIIRANERTGPPVSGGTVKKRQIKSIALISNQAFSQLNFRGTMIRDMVKRGIKVYVLAPDYSSRLRRKAQALGAYPINISMDRIGVNPIIDIKDLFLLTGILKDIKPDAVLSNFIKPVIYGSLAAKKAGISNIFSMISGLGYLFTQSPERASLKNPVFKNVASALYGLALNYNHRVFFHNPDDLATFLSARLVQPDMAARIYGSGVDVDFFKPVGAKPPGLTFILMARLLVEKGVREYVEAAKIIKKKYPSSRFVLLGGEDINPAGLKLDEVNKWVGSGIVEWLGQVEDVRPWLKECLAYVLPSWREGTPRSTLEAMAMGKAVVTTDVPGCRETVFPDPETGKFERLENGKLKIGANGIMVPVRDGRSLALAMEFIIKNPQKAVEMGRQSRVFAEKYYDVNKVNRVILREMGIT